MNIDTWIRSELADLHGRHLDRAVATRPMVGGKLRLPDGRAFLNFSSNDYLDLAGRPALAEAAIRMLQSGGGSGATASRLMGGALPVHDELETRLARFKDYPAALLYGSGYLANTGVIPALVGRHDLVLADRLIHASCIDGILLSRARTRRFHHNDVDHVRDLLRARPAGGRCLVVTESVFSMEGDLAPLPDLAQVCEEHGAMLMVDEAHATGVFGPRGSGLVTEHRLCHRVAISMATLGKALGCYGGAICCSELLRDHLINRSRTLIYATALPPAVAAASLTALDILEQETDLGPELLRRAAAFRQQLRDAGLDTLRSASPIVPVLLGDSNRARTVAERLLGDGIIAHAIRPPTVPEGGARLRLSVTLAHTPADLQRAAASIARAVREVR